MTDHTIDVSDGLWLIREVVHPDYDDGLFTIRDGIGGNVLVDIAEIPALIEALNAIGSLKWEVA